MTSVNPKKLSFKQQQLRFREDAILDAVNRLLSLKGFDLMTMDEVASEVGISKASLYKHFESKEELAAASMTRLIDDSLAAHGLGKGLSPIQRLKAVMRWAVTTHLAGSMPSLPSTRSTIQHALIGYAPYAERVAELTELLGGWILRAQETGDLSPDIPGEVILYTIYARSCDPVADFLKNGGAFTDDEIVGYVERTCFDGMTGSR